MGNTGEATVPMLFFCGYWVARHGGAARDPQVPEERGPSLAEAAVPAPRA